MARFFFFKYSIKGARATKKNDRNGFGSERIRAHTHTETSKYTGSQDSTNESGSAAASTEQAAAGENTKLRYA